MFLVLGLVSPRTWLAFIHHLAGLFIGVVAFFVIGYGLALGGAFLPLALAGLVLFGLALRFADRLARAERARFAVLLGEPIPAWPEDPDPRFRWLFLPRRATLTGRRTWGSVGYGLLRLPVSVLVASITLAIWAFGLVMLTLPLYGGLLPGGGVTIGGTVLPGPLPDAASAVAGLLLLLAAPPVTRRLATADAALARRLLAPPRDLEARVAELEVSRERVMDAAETERRRIERDLHDGAQQRLVALTMELGRARARFADDVDAARDLVDQAHAEAKAALTELRNLVRGMHPPVLTDRGLDAALSGLAALCPVPVEVQVDVPVRPKAAVEAVAYFTIAEALTNVAKHARATHASVVVEGHGYPGTLTIVISDDGIGGADPRGAGLSGLADRVSGVDGTLSVESPSGGPTIISAVLSCG
ncbi:MAG TPA: sensor domain-containing protein [Streptosporangiaceae bacterium]|nr:sensor domain-containing protein [Streptosporangiaceae bacterium]